MPLLLLLLGRVSCLTGLVRAIALSFFRSRAMLVNVEIEGFDLSDMASKKNLTYLDCQNVNSMWMEHRKIHTADAQNPTSCSPCWKRDGGRSRGRAQREMKEEKEGGTAVHSVE